MDWLNLGISAVAAVEAGDLAVAYLPASLDFGNFPIREYGGAIAGVYGAHTLMGSGTTDLAKVAVEGAAAKFASDLGQQYLPDSLDIAGFSVRRYLGAAVGIWAAKASGADKAVAKAV